MPGPSNLQTLPPQANVPFADTGVAAGAGRGNGSSPTLVRFQAVTVPAVAQGNPSIDGTGVRMILPTAKAFADLLYLGDAVVAGTFPRRVLTMSFHLVDLLNNSSWSNAVISVRRGNSPDGVFQDYASAITMAKTSAFATITADELDSAFIGLVWTTGETSAVPNALEIWAHLNGD